MKLSKTLKQWLIDNNYASEGDSDATFNDALDGAVKDGEMTPDKAMSLERFALAEVMGLSVDGTRKSAASDNSTTSEQAFGGKSAARVDVKAPSARYCEKRCVGKHVRTGEPVRMFGKAAELPSERDFARAGALFKHRCKRAGADVVLNEHEQQLVLEMYNKDTWCGQINGSWSNEIMPAQAKGLLNDAGSGGSYIDPLWYDQAVITYPVLFGELMPYVDLVEVPRGVTINSAGIANPAVSWGVAEGTSIGLFNTAALIQPLNSSVNNVTFAMTIGRDLLADTVVDLGRHVLENIGQVSAQEMDKVIAVGDGTTQPQGIANASGLNLVPSATGVGAPLSWSDLESLYFGVSKTYRKPSMRTCYIANDSSYMRFKQIPVGTSDARRLSGQDNYSSYTALGEPFRVSQDLPDTTIIFGAMSRYRLYRRQGSETRIVTDGQTLALTNQILVIMRGRYAGRVMDGNSFSIMTNAPIA